MTKELWKKEVEIISGMIEKVLASEGESDAYINQMIGVCNAMDWMAGCYADDANKEIVRNKFNHYKEQLIRY